MKLLRYGEVGSERPGLLDADGTIRDLSAYVADIAGTALHPASLDMLSKLDPKSLPAVYGSPRIGACVSEAEALDYVAGYCVSHDVSERAFQAERQGQWTKGKSCDTFGPIGPWLVTKDEVADPQNIKMWLTVNGKTMQNGSTKTMVYGVAYLVSYLSQFMSLHPGDIISTGTPPGVGLGMKPPVFLKAGDVVELGIEGMGQQKQTFKADE